MVEDRIRRTLASLERNGFSVSYCSKVAEARDRVLELIPKGSTVGIGDSVSVRQLGVIEELERNGRVVVNPFRRDISEAINRGEVSEHQIARIDRLALCCECFLTGSNIVTEDGKLLNVDGAGNRVVGQVFGPEKVVLVVGANKIVCNLDEGIQRLKTVVGPVHARMKERNTPCVLTGECSECNSPERICNVICVLMRSPTMTEIHVVMVGQDLGLGWDRTWDTQRIAKIRMEYERLTWIRKFAISSSDWGNLPR